jgi:hypothetical protein
MAGHATSAATVPEAWGVASDWSLMLTGNSSTTGPQGVAEAGAIKAGEVGQSGPRLYAAVS